MASTREERLQMRQRGAGTRKIQQFDFGLSFGGQAIGVPASASIPLIPEPVEASQSSTAPTAATPPSTVTAQSIAQGDSRPQRTPGSARNQLPQRPSTFDIPPDNGHGERQSNKKRKLNPSNETAEISSRRSPRRSPNGDPAATQNGSKAAEAPRREASDSAPEPFILSNKESPMSNRIEEALQTETNGVGLPTVADQAQTTTPESRTHIPLASEIRVTPLDKAQPSNEPPRENQPAEQRETTERSRKTARKSRSPPQPDKAGKVGQARPAKIASPKAPSPPSSKGKKPETVATRKRGASKDAPEAGQESISPSGHDTEAEGASVNITEQNERVQRPSKATKKTQNGEGAAPTTGSEAGKARHPRNRASLDKPADAVESRPASPAEPATQTNEQSSGSSTRRGRQAAKRAGAPPDPEVEGRQRQDSSSELAQAAVKGPKEGKSSARKAAKKAQSQPEHEPEPEIEVEEPEQPEEPEPESQSGPSKSRRGKAGKKDKRATETQPIARKEQPAPAPPEPEVEAEPEPAASGSSTSRRAAGRKATETQTAVTEEEPEQADAAPRRSTRKTREPRGEAVPVTVHRLANTSAFEISHGDFGEDDGSPGDETSAQPKTQLLNRGGVNPADVLSQICRETLEKTLATLKNGIDNETNQSKRAEWTRKRRAVEAFSTELDGRLLDLSEMLDSNFVLGVQLKKSKRDMMDLRGHLYKVRKERESVALQMDAVRAKHMEEENAKTARMTINNSLHSLELALDRGQNRAPAEAEPLSATLDFMLRTVADDVSSRAPGAQGGLLNQIRAFNVQLESTARHLERK